jgi:hypothetical protein
MGGTLFMAYEDVADVVLGHLIVDVYDCSTRQPKDDLNSFGFQAFKKYLGSC